jgi:hypothetical protein
LKIINSEDDMEERKGVCIRKDNMPGDRVFKENKEAGRHVRGMRDKAEVKAQDGVEQDNEPSSGPAGARGTSTRKHW